MVEAERIRVLRDLPVRPEGRFVLYWMQQSQRAEQNPALVRAIEWANRCGLPVVVAFVLVPNYPLANLRHYRFMLEGLRETRQTLRRWGIGWVTRIGPPVEIIPDLAREAAIVVFDRGYMPVQVEWRTALSRTLPVRVEEVEGDVVVPVEVASDHLETAARTLRPKLLQQVAKFLVPVTLPRLRRRAENLHLVGVEWEEPEDLLATLPIARDVPPSETFHGGTTEARRHLQRFIEHGLARYADRRADPTAHAESNLSPYLHFGQLSPIEIARAVQNAEAPPEARAAFLEQLVVRRELAINYVRYAAHPGTWESLPAWARHTLEEHARDPRPYVYDRTAWASAATHDPVWNAAQWQLLRTGKIHNQLRMYWGKKILEWTRDPREAFQIALWLNDWYALDGRDPNGWANVGWCFGLHDRPWPTRPIYGAVRAMGLGGLRRKFDVEAYVRQWTEGSQGEPSIGAAEP